MPVIQRRWKAHCKSCTRGLSTTLRPDGIRAGQFPAAHFLLQELRPDARVRPRMLTPVASAPCSYVRTITVPSSPTAAVLVEFRHDNPPSNRTGNDTDPHVIPSGEIRLTTMFGSRWAGAAPWDATCPLRNSRRYDPGARILLVHASERCCERDGREDSHACDSEAIEGPLHVVHARTIARPTCQDEKLYSSTKHGRTEARPTGNGRWHAL
jgi:hypothetical protein